VTTKPNRCRGIRTLAVGAVLLAMRLPMTAWAAEAAPEMVTDRPDQTESTPLVTPGRWQVEMGWTHAETASGAATLAGDALPETLLRVGLIADRVELRLIHAGWGMEALRPGGSLGSGLNDGAVGFKFGLLKEAALRPDVSLNVHTSVPIGAKDRTSDRFDPDFRFLIAHSLPADFALSCNLGAAWSPAASIEYTLSLGVPLGGDWGGFVESFGDLPAAGGAGAHLVDGGITWGLRPNLQLDLAGGAGLSDSAEDWFGGVGISVRYPD